MKRRHLPFMITLSDYPPKQSIADRYDDGDVEDDDDDEEDDSEEDGDGGTTDVIIISCAGANEK